MAASSEKNHCQSTRARPSTRQISLTFPKPTSPRQRVRCLGNDVRDDTAIVPERNWDGESAVSEATISLSRTKKERTCYTEKHADSHLPPIIKQPLVSIPAKTVHAVPRPPAHPKPQGGNIRRHRLKPIMPLPAEYQSLHGNTSSRSDERRPLSPMRFLDKIHQRADHSPPPFERMDEFAVQLPSQISRFPCKGVEVPNKPRLSVVPPMPPGKQKKERKSVRQQMDEEQRRNGRGSAKPKVTDQLTNANQSQEALHGGKKKEKAKREGLQEKQKRDTRGQQNERKRNEKEDGKTLKDAVPVMRSTAVQTELTYKDLDAMIHAYSLQTQHAKVLKETAQSSENHQSILQDSKQLDDAVREMVYQGATERHPIQRGGRNRRTGVSEQASSSVQEGWSYEERRQGVCEATDETSEQRRFVRVLYKRL